MRALALIDDLLPTSHPEPLLHPLTGPYERVGGYGHGPPMALQLGLSPSGKLICTGLLIGWQLDAPPSVDVRKLPMSERTRVSAREVHEIKLQSILDDLEPVPWLGEGDILDIIDRLLARPRKSNTGAGPLPAWLQQQLPVVRAPDPGPEGYDDEHYKMVVVEYKKALAEGRPMKSLARQFGRGEATLYRWLDEAEKRGFLPKRDKGARRGPRLKGSSPKRKEGTR